MIDLRKKALPDCLEMDGERLPIYTDFRTWISFQAILEEDGIASYCIFKEEPPTGDSWVSAALEFLQSPVSTPHGGEVNSNVRAFDWVEDGDYLVGTFQAVYGIDLTSEELHWHRFLALFRSLPEGCKMNEVMGYRLYTRSDARKKAETRYEEARRHWSLPPKKDKRFIAQQNAEFGGLDCLV